MAPSAQATHDPALAHPNSAAQGSQPAQVPTGVPPNLSSSELSALALQGLDQNQIIHLLRNLPVLTKLSEQNPKEDAAQILSNLAQAPFGQHLPVHYQPAGAGALPGMNEGGHNRGPPNLGQLSAVAMQAAPVNIQQPQGQQAQQLEDPNGDVEGQDGEQGSSTTPTTSAAGASGGRRNANRAAMGTDEWTRQRKDNHKEVERRRRGNINEGINELGRIVPSGSGEKAKGAILARAVQYIHHLKENEARNIEKWTLEKLLMDQAMGDLQAQLEEMRRAWEEERTARTRLDAELEVLKSMNGNAGAAASGAPATKEEGSATAAKRRSVDAPDSTGDAGAEAEREGKRQRTE
ncbi:hypothetical protein CPB83DRAFT_853272 [Crepidotus variabilis]|uniref:BHLH domain-containing protein n=1 Tax=Crepidotus variabilis TaxID=179855 RepID=A0A9P6EHL9_9AGAR|nr:hypothetical protein CPB83DRAFT_853272 [Crepidotus variabilis]